MNAQIITSPTGERLVVLAEVDYQALLDAAEDGTDLEVVRRFRERLASGEEELLPSEMVGRILDGENVVRVWREHRGLTAAALARLAGIAQSYLSQIESGKRTGSAQVLKRIASALGVTVDDLVVR